MTSLSVPVSDVLATTFIAGVASPRGLCLHVGADIFNVAIDDISVLHSTIFTVPPLTTTVPTTVAVTTNAPFTSRRILDFSGPGVCLGAVCSNGNSILQTYGDNEFLDVSFNANLDPATAGVLAASSGEPFSFWNGGYSDLGTVAFGNVENRMSQLCFRGADIEVSSFRLGAWASARNTNVRVFDVNGTLIFASLGINVLSNVSTLIAGPFRGSQGVCIQLGPDFYTVAMTAIDVSWSTRQTLPPTTTTLVIFIF